MQGWLGKSMNHNSLGCKQPGLDVKKWKSSSGVVYVHVYMHKSQINAYNEHVYCIYIVYTYKDSSSLSSLSS